MRSNLQGHLRLERIENSVTSGIPDVLALRRGCVTFAELKCAAALPARASTRLLGDDGLNPDQRNWHMDWCRNGGRSIILIGVKDTGKHWALWGNHGDDVNDMSVNELTRTAFCMGVRHGDGFWTRLLEQL